MLALKAKIRRFRFWKNLFFAYFRRYRLRTLLVFIFVFTIAFSIYKTIPKISQSNSVSLGYVGTYSLEDIPTPILSLTTQPLIAIDGQ